MVWTNARMPGIREGGMARHRMEPGGAYQSNISSSVTYPPPVSPLFRPTLMHTKNLYENGPNPFFFSGPKT